MGVSLASVGTADAVSVDDALSESLFLSLSISLSSPRTFEAPAAAEERKHRLMNEITRPRGGIGRRALLLARKERARAKKKWDCLL
jgi:hypothetical protein